MKSTGQKAFTKDRFRKIADFVTTEEDEVTKGIININTAPSEVLACLPDVDDALALAIVNERLGRDEGFTTAADILDVEGVSTDLFKKLAPYIRARSDVFSVRSFGVLGRGDLYCCAFAVIDRTEISVQIRYWRELE